MKNRPLAGLFVVLLGVLTLLTPYFIFPVCPGTVATASGGFVPMKCFWTARAVLGSGGLVVFAGLLLVFARRPAMRMGIALMLLPVGLLTIAIPYALIGVCVNEMMPCHMGTLPALCLLGLFTALAGALVFLRARRDGALARRNAARHSRA